MKKIIMAVITALLVAVAVPVLAASSEDNTCPVESCWQNNTSCNNGAYCRNGRSIARMTRTAAHRLAAAAARAMPTAAEWQ